MKERFKEIRKTIKNIAEKRGNRKQEIKDKYNLEEMSWVEISAIVIGKLTLTSFSLIKNIVFIFILVLVVVYFGLNNYFSKHQTTVAIPGVYTNASVLAKNEIENDPINLLSVKNFTIDSLTKHLAIKYMNRGYNEYIDKVQPQEMNQQTEIPIGSELFDMQMSAFLAVNNYIGNHIPYTNEIVVTKITVGGKVPPNLLPFDRIISIDGVKTTDPSDVSVAKLKYQLRDVVVVRNGEKAKLKTTFYGVDVKKVIILKNFDEYEKFYQFANLELEGYIGRSAGSSLALSYYNSQIEDVAKGRKIALTGTINPEGEIGFITGVRQKTVLALKNNTDIMFVPKDNEIMQNYTEAIEIVKSKKSSMKIVPVDNLSDIIHYLNSTN